MNGIKGKSITSCTVCYICGDERHEAFKCDLCKGRTDETRSGPATSGNGVAIVANIVTPVAMATVSGGKISETPTPSPPWLTSTKRGSRIRERRNT